MGHEASRASKRQDELSESLSLPVATSQPTKATAKPPAEKQRGRSAVRKGNAQDSRAQSSARMQSASPAPKQGPSVASVVTAPPAKDRARSQSRGRAPKQGK